MWKESKNQMLKPEGAKAKEGGTGGTHQAK